MSAAVRHGVADYDPATHVAHVTLEVVSGDDRALVSVTFDGRGSPARADEHAATRVVCSCGERSCAHAAAALRFLRTEPRPPRTSIPPGFEDLRRTVPGTRPAPPLDVTPRIALADALDDVTTTLVREGPEAASPTLEDALRRALAALRPTPLRLERLVGRLRTRLATRDTTAIVALLAQAARLADVLREDDEATVARWLGREAAPLVPAERLEEATLVEVAREWLPATQRAGMERRWLVVIAGARRGTLVSEDRRRGDPSPSLGPCPRVVTGGLVELEPGDAPRRAHLLQYEVSIAVTDAQLALVAELARRKFADLVPDDAQATLAEPFVLLAPTAIEDGPHGVVAVDEDGHRLLLRGHDPRGAAALLLARAKVAVPGVLTGRVVRAQGEVTLAPTSAVFGSTLLRLV